MADTLKVLHVITGLSTGGAEMTLYRLLGGLPRHAISAAVVSLSDFGPVGQRIQSLGVPVEALEMSSHRPSPGALLKLRHVARRFDPDLVQGWMYHGNLAALLARRASRRKVPVIWNIRHSLSDISHEKLLTRIVIALGARLCQSAASVVYNASVSAKQHEEHGFDASLSAVIPNGVDTSCFSRREHDGRALRQQLGISANARVVGSVARYHPQKAHDLFLESAAALVDREPEVEFILVGNGVDSRNTALTQLASKLGLSPRVHFLGERQDMPAVFAAMDVCTSSSVWGEGFPNVVAEAMACEVPCVVTDIGDSALVVGDTGIVVPPGDSRALVDGWCRMLAEDREACARRGESARARIREEFSLDRALDRYARLYIAAADAHGTGSRLGESD